MRVEVQDCRLSPTPIPVRRAARRLAVLVVRWRWVLLGTGLALAGLGLRSLPSAPKPAAIATDAARHAVWHVEQLALPGAGSERAAEPWLRPHEPDPPIQPELDNVRNASRYAPALADVMAQAAPGRPWLKTLHDEVRMACGLVHRPDGASARVDLDASRRPWLDALQQRCGGLPPSMLTPLRADDPIQHIWRQHVPANREAEAGAAAADALALDLLRESADSALLHEALRHLLAQDRLPMPRIYPGRSPPVRVDLEAALAPAADLVACRRSASCGSGGLSTLYLCAQHGCPPGSGLEQAMRWLLPRAQHENVLGMAEWVLQESSSSGQFQSPVKSAGTRGQQELAVRRRTPD
jgi:hypothetical protein